MEYLQQSDHALVVGKNGIWLISEAAIAAMNFPQNEPDPPSQKEPPDTAPDT
jgi:hypothetical protein